MDKNFFKLAVSAFAIFLSSCGSSDPGSPDNPPTPKPDDKEETVGTYFNPVIQYDCPDPTVHRAQDGYFYLVGTNTGVDGYSISMPVMYKSKDLVNWECIGSPFTEEGKPRHLANEKNGGDIWALDLNYINGQYVLYYSNSVWAGEETACIGVSVSDKPEGPYKDLGVIISKELMGTLNNIDQFFFQDNGKNYMFWGSFHGVWGIELTEDGLAIKPGAEKFSIGQGTEGTYIEKHGDYYYFFGSINSCCEGLDSKYQVVVGRSKKLEGPYQPKNTSWDMRDGHGEIFVIGDTEHWAGPGHNSEFITDDNGDQWVLYHSYWRDRPARGRVVCLDKVVWDEEGWPSVKGTHPSYERLDAPYFKEKE